jgi:hypothetical protein
LKPRKTKCQNTEQLITEGDPKALYKTLKEEGKGGFGVVFAAHKRGDKKRTVCCLFISLLVCLFCLFYFTLAWSLLVFYYLFCFFLVRRKSIKKYLSERKTI